MNDLLQVEGLEVSLNGIDPILRERTPSMPSSPSRETLAVDAPDFRRLLNDDILADVLSLSFRWQEAQKCTKVEAYLSAVVMMGSILEGVLLNRFEQHPEVGNRAVTSPKAGKTGKPKPFREWGLSRMIDVAHEVGWLQGDMSRYVHALRESRNIVHPYSQRVLNEIPSKNTCSICWEVVRASISQLLDVH